MLLTAPASPVLVGAAPPATGEEGRDRAPIPVLSLSLSLSPSELEAEITRSELGTVTFRGTLTVDQMLIMTSETTLQAMVNSGWPVVVSPQTFEITGPGQEPFQVTVIVPPATSALLTGTVLVNGQCKAPGLAPVSASCSGLVRVSPYYLADIIVSGSGLRVDPGGRKTVEVEVHNRANIDTDLTVSVVDKPKDVRVSFTESQFHMQPDESVFINVTFEAVSGASPGDSKMALVVDARTRDGGTQRVSSMNMSMYIPSLGARLGMGGVALIVVVSVMAVGVVVLWRKGKLGGLRLPRRGREST